MRWAAMERIDALRIDCLIIHLERAHARLPQVDATKEMLPLSTYVMPAVDGQQMSDTLSRSYNRKLLRPYYPFQLRPSEVATFHSHRACWRRIVDEDLDAALILEDDLELDPEVFLPALELAIANIEPGDFVRFPIKLREEAIREIASRGPIRLQAYDRIALGMVAQLVTRGAAEALLAVTEQFDRPVDDFLQMKWVHNVRVLTVWPSGVREISSELGGSLISRKSGIFDKVRREILRPIYRRKIRTLARRNLDASE
ncbi:glycosyltransferase family 25 protein [Roseovarius arcticus]|uniref:glycosyltransferase family 25 protein n=1 Tax=Roseovarius arcticus TaxID=2547404 RepID=UPI001BB116EC|nr:glycosyltransferase family 25 protein [Roseovarius arcticus]